MYASQKKTASESSAASSSVSEAPAVSSGTHRFTDNRQPVIQRVVWKYEEKKWSKIADPEKVGTYALPSDPVEGEIFDDVTNRRIRPLAPEPMIEEELSHSSDDRMSEENLRTLETILQALGVSASSGDYTKIIYHVIHSFSNGEMEQAKQYVWDMALRFRKVRHGEVSFPQSQPRLSLLSGMGSSLNSHPQHLYNEYYRKSFSPFVSKVVMKPKDFFGALMVSANEYEKNFRFAPQGREKESFRGHYEAAIKGNEESQKILQEAAAIRVLRRKENKASCLSRLTLTINPGLLKELVQTLSYLMHTHEVILNFKIMGLSNLLKGPDDVVIYLNQPIGSTAVKNLLRALMTSNQKCLSQRGEGFLRSSSPPMGMHTFFGGVFGADMPSDKEVIDKGRGSHGMNMSLLMSSSLETSKSKKEPLEKSFTKVFGGSGLNPFNPAYNNILEYGGLRLRMGEATGANMNCFIDSILQVGGMDRRLVTTISQSLDQLGIRPEGDMIETHSEVMNTIVAQIGHDAGVNLTVRIIFQNPYSAELDHMDVGSGDTMVFIYYNAHHFVPLTRQ